MSNFFSVVVWSCVQNSNEYNVWGNNGIVKGIDIYYLLFMFLFISVYGCLHTLSRRGKEIIICDCDNINIGYWLFVTFRCW